MADVIRAPQVLDDDLPAHQQTFHRFNRLVLFAILHIGLVLGSLALAFLGHSPLIATLLGVGGTAALLVAFAITS
jgi:hypothetical protein